MQTKKVLLSIVSSSKLALGIVTSRSGKPVQEVDLRLTIGNGTPVRIG